MLWASFYWFKNGICYTIKLLNNGDLMSEAVTLEVFFDYI